MSVLKIVFGIILPASLLWSILACYFVRYDIFQARIGLYHFALKQTQFSLDSIEWCGIILPAARNKQPGQPGRMIFTTEIALKNNERKLSSNPFKIVMNLEKLLDSDTNRVYNNTPEL